MALMVESSKQTSETPDCCVSENAIFQKLRAGPRCGKACSERRNRCLLFLAADHDVESAIGAAGEQHLYFGHPARELRAFIVRLEKFLFVSERSGINLRNAREIFEAVRFVPVEQ